MPGIRMCAQTEFAKCKELNTHKDPSRVAQGDDVMRIYTTLIDVTLNACEASQWVRSITVYKDRNTRLDPSPSLRVTHL